MSKRTIMITGAARGIGRAIAVKFAENPCNLVICCKSNTDKLNKLAEELEDKGCSVLVFTGDVSDKEFIENMVCEAIKHFGSIDVLVNNAGISYVGLLQQMSEDSWNKVITTNLSSVFHCSKTVIPVMLKAGSGHIINISSVWGSVGASCEVAYSASKGGINAFTKALAKELAPSHISVNAIACGMIDTDMNSCFDSETINDICDEIPSGRMGRPEEIAELAATVASQSTYLTGQILTMSGGWYI